MGEEGHPSHSTQNFCLPMHVHSQRTACETEDNGHFFFPPSLPVQTPWPAQTLMSPLFFGLKLARKENDPWNTIMQEMRPVGAADWPFVLLVHFVLLFAHQEIFYKLQHRRAPEGGGGGEGGVKELRTECEFISR